MLGEISTNGNFSALFLHQIAKAWKVKINTQVRTGSNFTLGCQNRLSESLEKLCKSTVTLAAHAHPGLNTMGISP